MKTKHKALIWNLAVWLDLFVFRNAPAYRVAARTDGFVSAELLGTHDLWRLYHRSV